MREDGFLYNPITLSERIEDLRKGNGKDKITLKSLSEQIENKTGVYISHTQLGVYENPDKKENISINNLLAIANFYGVPLNYLLGITNSKRNNFTDQMVFNKFSLSDNAMSQLSKFTKNKSFSNNEFKLALINYIIENEAFLNNIAENLLKLYKFKDNNKTEEYNMERFTLSRLFDNFIDISYEQLWKDTGATKNFLFDIPEKTKRRKK